MSFSVFTALIHTHRSNRFTWVQLIYVLSHVTFYCFFLCLMSFLIKILLRNVTFFIIFYICIYVQNKLLDLFDCYVDQFALSYLESMMFTVGVSQNVVCGQACLGGSQY